MTPRLRATAEAARLLPYRTQYTCQQCRFASVLSAATSAPAIQESASIPPVATIVNYPPTQPPSYKPAEFRKTQLHRQYQSALRSTQLMVIFQHNNLKALEWSGIRRELANALRKVDTTLAEAGNNDYLGDSIKLQIVQTGIFASAMKVVEFWNPRFDQASDASTTSSSSSPRSSQQEPGLQGSPMPTESRYKFTHGLSKSAWRKTHGLRSQTGLETLMTGPIAIMTFPVVSPQHLSAALSILAPSPAFPAPKRKAVPTYHEPVVQSGIQKLMLLGARVEGKAFDAEGVRWVGGIPGGLDGLRAQLVAMLSGVGAGITNTLEAAGRTLYITVESRRSQLEEESKPKDAETPSP